MAERRLIVGCCRDSLQSILCVEPGYFWLRSFWPWIESGIVAFGRRKSDCNGKRVFRTTSGNKFLPVFGLLIAGSLFAAQARQVDIHDPAMAKEGDTYYLFSSGPDRKSTRLNSSHRCISYAVFCLKKNKA